MKKILLPVFLFLLCTKGFCITWVVTNTGFTFTPADLTITFGDNVDFQLESIHSAIEVSLDTWNANETSPIIGFATPLGGGTVLSNQLPVGIHYFVCQNHASMGMKGTITVQAVTNVIDNFLKSKIGIYPNPTTGKFVLDLSGTQFEKYSDLGICNINGKEIYQTSILIPKSVINLSDKPKGIYFLRITNRQTILTKTIVIN